MTANTRLSTIAHDNRPRSGARGDEPVRSGLVDCPVCGGAIMHTGPSKEYGHSGSWEDHVECGACGARVHPECYWGRVATLEEWQATTGRRRPGDYAAASVCARCRPKAP